MKKPILMDALDRMKIYDRQQNYLEAIAQQKAAKRSKHRDASAKQAAAIPSIKTKLKKRAKQLIKQGKAKWL